MPDAHDQRIILTPGPVTTEPLTRQAMLRDFTPNEPDLLALTAEMRERLVAMVSGEEGYVCVPVQGVGNTANEAVLGTLVPRERKVLIVDNGFYGARLKEIAAAIGVPFAVLALPWIEPVTGARLDAALAADAAISHVIVCHVDTGTGLLNPIEPLAEVARRRGVALIVDAIASFGGLPIDAAALDPRRSSRRRTSGSKACRASVSSSSSARRSQPRPAGRTRSASICIANGRASSTTGAGGSRRRPRPPPPWSRRCGGTPRRARRPASSGCAATGAA
jgi:aspartate aminotransferase-like enzyme